MSERYFYAPRDGHGLQHNPIASIVGPRPIAWISSIGATGDLNLAPYSFFGIFNYTPPIVAFASAGFKDSLHNAVQQGEFLCADRFTAADVAVAYALQLAQHLGLTGQFLNATADYWQRLQARPGFQRALQAQHRAALEQGVDPKPSPDLRPS